MSSFFFLSVSLSISFSLPTHFSFFITSSLFFSFIRNVMSLGSRRTYVRSRLILLFSSLSSVSIWCSCAWYIYMCVHTSIYIYHFSIYFFFFTFDHLFHSTYDLSHRDMKFSLVFLFFLSVFSLSVSALLGIFIFTSRLRIYMYVCNTYSTCLDGT